jgi:ornithine cyclodeaminase/alanine dehydrogenase-like protein (mu-crystallin family)
VTFRRSKIVVDFRDQVLDEAGDLREAIRSGVIGPEAIHAELADVIVGTKAGRTDDREITLFKSVGMALEDIATAGFVYQRALASGLGTKIALEEPALVSMGAGAAAL